MTAAEAFWCLAGPALAYVSPLVFALILAAALGEDAARDLVYAWMIGEISPVEIGTFVVLMVAAVMAFRLAIWERAALGRLAALCMGLFGAALALVAMEEASWGQWYLGFETPASIAEINHQGELNVHNIYLQGKTEILRALFGAAGLAAVFAARALVPFRTLAAPLVMAPWFLVMMVLPLYELATDYWDIVPLLDRAMRSKYFSEIQELVIAASAVVYLSFVRRRLANAPAAAT